MLREGRRGGGLVVYTVFGGLVWRAVAEGGGGEEETEGGWEGDVLVRGQVVCRPHV